MNTQDIKIDYWNYYLMLENKFLNTLNYVELSPKNYSTYSNEYAHLIQTIGAELDNCFKGYCGFAPHEIKTITDYANLVINKWPEITKQAVKIGRNRIVPFDGWNCAKAKQSLFWWEAFDKIKHSRVANFENASQKNTLYILAGLYMLEMKWFKEEADNNNEVDIMFETSRIFTLENWETRYNSFNDIIMTVDGTSMLMSNRE